MLAYHILLFFIHIGKLKFHGLHNSVWIFQHLFNKLSLEVRILPPIHVRRSHRREWKHGRCTLKLLLSLVRRRWYCRLTLLFRFLLFLLSCLSRNYYNKNCTLIIYFEFFIRERNSGILRELYLVVKQQNFIVLF
ncbi:uncharacterized protein VICG_00414 [Vittaforma corneae ATCC 50505]|uniref:Uncharacterized protein n=1 Tax=Vittaforma corneae (strain ATCC 50505) TaxID=993615 RepID=L2GQS5_VITCO|nr:uncharacterized protein VICG_00414 [Vittaforma corneae ATCC 50505]ELA42662.1 hypothetical protein VICG_00414 [Vittaforma corneae ATCC 50505]